MLLPTDLGELGEALTITEDQSLALAMDTEPPFGYSIFKIIPCELLPVPWTAT